MLGGLSVLTASPATKRRHPHESSSEKRVLDGRLRMPGEEVELEDDEAARFEEAKRCVRIQQPAQKQTPCQEKKTEQGNA